MILIGSVYMPDADDGHEADYIYEAAAKIPVFLLDAYLEGKNIYSFICGNYEAVYDVTSAFIRRGRKRILFLGDFDIASTKEKLRGYEMALSDAGYPVLGELKPVSYTHLDVYKRQVYTLESSGYQAKGFKDAKAFYPALEEEKPELILLDIMLPGEDGLSILEKLRKNKATKDIPVMMVTARGSEYDKILGLDGGADDYITKPFGMMEFLARVRAILRRSQKPSGAQEMYELSLITI